MMKSLIAGLVSLAGLGLAQVNSTTTSSAGTPGPTGAAIPTTSGTLFTLDGETSYFAGTNCYWCSFLTVQEDVDLVMDHLQEAGLRILRIWGFNDVNTKPTDATPWFQYLSADGSEINTDEATGLPLLDYVASAAGARGIKLIVNFVNNWDDYGGITAYTTAFGGDHQGWFTSEAAQAQYRAYVEAVVGRFAGSEAILAWELANEPRCNGCETDVIYNWAANTSAWIKELDPDHLVTLGDEGFGLPGDGSYPYTYGEGVDWEQNLQIETLDFATFHLYPDSWGTTNDWGNGWVESHAELCVSAGKPCLFEEYGTTSDHCSIESPWQETSLAADGMAGDLFWQLGDTLSTGQSHDDGNTIYYGTDDWTCLVTDHVAAI